MRNGGRGAPRRRFQVPAPAPALRIPHSAFRILAAATFLSLFALAFPAVAQTERVVTAIAFQGKLRTSAERLKTRIVTREGRPFSRETLDQDIKRLYGLGQFSVVEAKVEEDGQGGVRITFFVEEKPIVHGVDIAGMKAFPKEEFRLDLRMRAGLYLSDYLIKVDEELILARYKEKDYPFVEVQTWTQELEDGSVDVYYQVTEGPRTGIDKVEFRGNVAVPAKELRTILLSWQLWLFGLYPSGNYSESALAVDADRLRQYYRSLGYLDAKVQVGGVVFEPDKSSCSVVFDIEEGSRYRVSEVRVQGNRLFSADEVLAGMSLKPGDFFASESLRKDLANLERKYGREAYIFARVDFDLAYDEEAGSVTLLIRIEEGEKISVERIIFRGNSHTRDEVIRRELSLYPGEPFDYEKWEDSFNRLAQRRYFNPINIDFEPGSAPDKRDVVVQVGEDRTGVILIGGGFASGIGAFGNFAITQRNFDITNLPRSWDDFFSGETLVGGGQYLEFRAQPGFERSVYRLVFREPWLGGRPLSFGIDGFLFSMDRLRYLETRRGGELTFGRRIQKDYLAQASLGVQEVGVEDISVFAPPSVARARGKFTLSTARPSFRVSKEKLEPGSYYPYAGYSGELACQVTGGPMGGEIDFWRLEAEGAWHATAFDVAGWGKHVVSVRGNLGWQEPNKNTREVPVYERFYLGGPLSMRGFSFRGIGPHEGVDAVGGNTLAKLQLEYSVPVGGPTVRALAFFDTGSLVPEWDDLDPDTFRMSYGLGLRIMVPIFQAPLAMDFGWPLRKKDEDETQVFQLFLGFGF